MAKYDQGGGCACGLKRYCDCGSGQADGSGMPNPEEAEEYYAKLVKVEKKELDRLIRLADEAKKYVMQGMERIIVTGSQDVVDHAYGFADKLIDLTDSLMKIRGR